MFKWGAVVVVCLLQIGYLPGIAFGNVYLLHLVVHSSWVFDMQKGKTLLECQPGLVLTFLQSWYHGHFHVTNLKEKK